jgi:hypothetical protein
VILVCGKNRTGKTTLARRLVSGAELPCIIAPSGEWGQWSAEPEKLVTEALKSPTCTTLVLDDCDAYLSGKTSEYWRKLLILNRHVSLDIVLVTRRPQDLPHFAVATATRAYLFKLGPRESRWCARTLGHTPPEEPYITKAITL